MTIAPKPKRGRKAKHYVDPETGKQIFGLGHDERSGRWRIIGTNTFFREPDPKKAVQRFYLMTRKEPPLREQVTHGVYLPDHVGTLLGKILAAVAQRDYEEVQSLPRKIRDDDTDAVVMRMIGEEILRKPKWAAEKSGVEQFGYLLDLKPPKPLPTLDELEDVWQKHAKCGSVQKKKVLRAWRDFRRGTGISDLRDITPEVVVAYSDELTKRIINRKDGTRGPMTGKQQAHIFGGIRRLLRFAKSRALAIDVIRERLDYLELLQPTDCSTNLDPKPIELEDWMKLHAVADGEELAMILLMLNGCLYIQEVINLQWDDIKNGCIVTNRRKTGKCIRVCVLWPETIAALAQRKRKGAHIFNTCAGLPIKVSGAQRRWQRLALKAGLATERIANYKGVKKRVIKCHVTASQLRDGAYTAAASANVNSEICRLLGGHRCGIQDHYVRRNPKMVAPACDAVYAHYLENDTAAAAA
jgi:integrase